MDKKEVEKILRNYKAFKSDCERYTKLADKASVGMDFEISKLQRETGESSDRCETFLEILEKLRGDEK